MWLQHAICLGLIISLAIAEDQCKKPTAEDTIVHVDFLYKAKKGAYLFQSYAIALSCRKRKGIRQNVRRNIRGLEMSPQSHG